jgi:hypothetical protein
MVNNIESRNMQNLKIKEIIDLIVAEVPDAETRIEKIFDWHFERTKVTSQWILGAAATLFISVLVSFFKSELNIPWWIVLLIAIFALATASYGIYLLWQLRLLHLQYIATLKIYNKFKKIRPFLILYRTHLGG